MQLTFPNGEHPSVPLQGEVAVGTRPGLRVSLPGSGLAAHHASFISDRRGLWLRVLPPLFGKTFVAAAAPFLTNPCGRESPVSAEPTTTPVVG